MPQDGAKADDDDDDSNDEDYGDEVTHIVIVVDDVSHQVVIVENGAVDRLEVAAGVLASSRYLAK